MRDDAAPRLPLLRAFYRDDGGEWRPMFDGRVKTLAECAAAYEHEKLYAMFVRASTSTSDADLRLLSDVLLRRAELPGYGLVPVARIPQSARVYALVHTLLRRCNRASELWRVATAHRGALTATLGCWAVGYVGFIADRDKTAQWPAEEAEAAHALLLASLRAFPDSESVISQVFDALSRLRECPSAVVHAQPGTLEALLVAAISTAEDAHWMLEHKPSQQLFLLDWSDRLLRPEYDSATSAEKYAHHLFPFCTRALTRDLQLLDRGPMLSSELLIEVTWNGMPRVLELLVPAKMKWVQLFRPQLLPTLRLILRVLDHVAASSEGGLVEDAMLPAVKVIVLTLKELLGGVSSADRTQRDTADCTAVVMAVFASRAARLVARQLRESLDGETLHVCACLWVLLLTCAHVLQLCPAGYASMFTYLQDVELEGELAVAQQASHKGNVDARRALSEAQRCVRDVRSMVHLENTAAEEVAERLAAEEAAQRVAARARADSKARKKERQAAAARARAEADAQAAAAEAERMEAERRAAAAAQAAAEQAAAAERAAAEAAAREEALAQRREALAAAQLEETRRAMLAARVAVEEQQARLRTLLTPRPAPAAAAPSASAAAPDAQLLELFPWLSVGAPATPSPPQSPQAGMTQGGAAGSDDDGDDGSCVICMDDERTTALEPCGHALLCAACADKVLRTADRACPVCRATASGCRAA